MRCKVAFAQGGGVCASNENVLAVFVHASLMAEQSQSDINFIVWLHSDENVTNKSNSGRLRVKRVWPKEYRAPSEGVLGAGVSGCGGSPYRTVVQVSSGAASSTREEIDRRWPHSLNLTLS